MAMRMLNRPNHDTLPFCSKSWRTLDHATRSGRVETWVSWGGWGETGLSDSWAEGNTISASFRGDGEVSES